jgi:hypothetical protein
MASTPRRWRTLVIALTAIVAVLTVTSPSSARPPDGSATAPSAVQRQIDQHLTAYPGGQQISETEISYAGGKFVLTFERPIGILAAADCPAGWFCFYDGINYGYPRGQLSSCGWQDLYNWGWHDRTEAVHYNLSSGSVSFLNHGSVPSHSSDTYLFSVSASYRTDNDVSPYRNRADHVNRYC